MYRFSKQIMGDDHDLLSTKADQITNSGEVEMHDQLAYEVY